MSEKRFYELISSIDYYQIWDKQEDKGYTIENAVDKLNSLADENRELRRDLENSYGANATLEGVIFKLGEMNAQYREQLMKIPENIREVWLE